MSTKITVWVLVAFCAGIITGFTAAKWMYQTAYAQEGPVQTAHNRIPEPILPCRPEQLPLDKLCKKLGYQ